MKKSLSLLLALVVILTAALPALAGIEPFLEFDRLEKIMSELYPESKFTQIPIRYSRSFASSWEPSKQWMYDDVRTYSLTFEDEFFEEFNSVPVTGEMIIWYGDGEQGGDGAQIELLQWTKRDSYSDEVKAIKACNDYNKNSFHTLFADADDNSFVLRSVLFCMPDVSDDTILDFFDTALVEPLMAIDPLRDEYGFNVAGS